MKTLTPFQVKLSSKQLKADIVIPALLWVCIVVGFVIVANAFAVGI